MSDLMKSLSNMIRDKKDQLADMMSDPVKDGKYAIEDSEKEIAEFTTKIAKLIAETRQLGKQKETAEEDAAKYMAIARSAAKRGNEDDVRQAIVMKNKAQERKVTLEDEMKRNEDLTAKLRNQLNNARVKVADAKSNLARLSARMEGAKVRKDLAKASTTFNNDDSPLAALNDLQRTVDQSEAEAEAWEEIAEQEDQNAGKNLEDKYMDGDQKAIDNEVAALMASAKKK